MVKNEHVESLIIFVALGGGSIKITFIVYNDRILTSLEYVSEHFKISNSSKQTCFLLFNLCSFVGKTSFPLKYKIVLYSG